MARNVVHFEIGCSNIEQATAFYANVFNWELNRSGNAAYVNTGDTSPLSGHLNQLGPDDLQQYVTVYIETKTLQEDLAAIVRHGGEVFVQPVLLPDGRSFAWFKDVSGNLLGLISKHQPSTL